MKLILLLALIIAFSTGCNWAQKPAHTSSKIDTVRLFNPHPDTSGDADSKQMFQYTASLMDGRYGIVVNAEQFKAKDLDQLLESITKYADAIKSHRFFIFTDSTTPFDNIMAVTSRLQTLKIDNYRVINAWEFFKPEEPMPVVVKTPPMVIERPIPDSPNDLKITVLERTYKCSRSGQERILKDTSQIAALLENSEQFASGNRVIIIASVRTKYDRIESLIKVLGEHHIYTFNLVTQ